ncbi:uncharacterized protein N7511_005630 [Penicillium nucicola]|uniref:uncharacterized protein n=1 Tax=Penicillium nucicola TaxID=1850975 RepID=UPI002544E27F|nr:uncharacterized protein N7511_005630 [Penicillium nucicola]KAJ5762248.1 hypothetical protein N7511_005630 [Penicillium nucicola]
MAADWFAIQSLCGVSYPIEVPENPTNVTDIAGFAPPVAIWCLGGAYCVDGPTTSSISSVTAVSATATTALKL